MQQPVKVGLGHVICVHAGDPSTVRLSDLLGENRQTTINLRENTAVLLSRIGGASTLERESTLVEGCGASWKRLLEMSPQHAATGPAVLRTKVAEACSKSHQLTCFFKRHRLQSRDHARRSRMRFRQSLRLPTGMVRMWCESICRSRLLAYTHPTVL
jgi:hypothetical protein